MQEQNNPLFYSEGGVGDTLQHLPFMLLNKHLNPRYCMMNHYKGAKELLKSLGIKPEYTFYYKNDIQKLDLLRGMGLKTPMESVPRTKYFNYNPFPKQKPLYFCYLTDHLKNLIKVMKNLQHKCFITRILSA